MWILSYGGVFRHDSAREGMRNLRYLNDFGSGAATADFLPGVSGRTSLAKEKLLNQTLQTVDDVA